MVLSCMCVPDSMLIIPGISFCWREFRIFRRNKALGERLLLIYYKRIIVSSRSQTLFFSTNQQLPVSHTGNKHSRGLQQVTNSRVIVTALFSMSFVLYQIASYNRTKQVFIENSHT